ncbi:MAG: hypothetical protein PF485_05655 [Bacteroidales bacterium]|jgi:hypothetical protein|nr:hypothetical protein [Bacteroidales bacterium]
MPNNDLKKIIITIISGFVLLMATGLISGYKFKKDTIRSNTKAIDNMKGSKVDQVKFNQFVKMYAEFSVLTEERYNIINKRLDKLEGRQREIELTKLARIEQNINIIQEKMKRLLQEYGMYTRDGGEINIPLHYFINEET